MVARLKSEPVKGGKIARSVKTGRFIEVQTSKGTSKSRVKTERIVKEASSKRKNAMKRLVNR